MNSILFLGYPSSLSFQEHSQASHVSDVFASSLACISTATSSSPKSVRLLWDIRGQHPCAIMLDGLPWFALLQLSSQIRFWSISECHFRPHGVPTVVRGECCCVCLWIYTVDCRRQCGVSSSNMLGSGRLYGYVLRGGVSIRLYFLTTKDS
jgi:hypothetical protein